MNPDLNNGFQAIKAELAGRCLLSDNDREFFRLALWERNLRPEAVAAFINGLHLKEERSGFLLLAAHLAHRTGCAGIDAGHHQKLMGVVRHYTVRNSILTIALTRQLNTLLNHQVRMLFFKGMAMKLGYTGEQVRAMNDMDILLGPESYQTARELLEAQGYTGEDEGHSVDLNNGMDLHRVIYKNFSNPEREAPLWTRARKIKAFNRELLVAGPEDLLAVLLHHEAGNLLDSFPTEPRRYRFINDFWTLVNKVTPDWDLFIAICREQHVEAGNLAMLEAVNALFPGHLPMEKFRREMSVDMVEVQTLLQRRKIRDLNAGYDALLLKHGSLLRQTPLLLKIILAEFRLRKLYHPQVKFIEFLLSRWHVRSAGEFFRKFADKTLGRLRHADHRTRAVISADAKRTREKEETK